MQRAPDSAMADAQDSRKAWLFIKIELLTIQRLRNLYHERVVRISQSSSQRLRSNVGTVLEHCVLSLISKGVGTFLHHSQTLLAQATGRARLTSAAPERREANIQGLKSTGGMALERLF